MDEGDPHPTSPARSRGGDRTQTTNRNQKPGPAGLLVSGVEETLVGRFGGGVRRLIKAKTLRIRQHESEIPAHLNDGKGGIRGVYDPTGNPSTGLGADTTWMVADNLTAADAPSVFLHELGVHYGLERMLGSDKYQDIIRQMKAMEALGNEAVRAARAAIPKGTPKAAVDDELLAYLVEKHPELPLVKRIIAAIRAFLFRHGLIKNIRPEDVVALAKAAARHAARTPTLPSPATQGRESVAYSGSPLWYSEMARFLDDKAPGKAPAAQWKMLLANWAKQGKFKGDEFAWSGISEWLTLQEGAVTKDQVLGFVRENGVRVEETTLGLGIQLTPDEKTERDELTRRVRTLSAEERQRWDELKDKTEGTEPKHAQWQLPGGEKYRELLLRLPAKEPQAFDIETHKKEWAEAEKAGDQDRMFDLAEKRKQWLSEKASLESKSPKFTSSHYPEPNILAHIRFNERISYDSDKRVLFIEEIQSDWAQKGKKEGFKPTSDGEFKQLNAELVKLREVQEAGEIGEPAYEAAVTREGEIVDRMNARHDAKIPSAPFVSKTEAWVALALKRMIRHAAENGFDRVAWTTGDQQADRYPEALRKVIDEIEWFSELDGSKRVTGDKDGRTVFYATIDGRGILSDASTNDEMNGKHAADVFGKDMSQRILGEPNGNLGGLDFNVAATE